MGMNKTDYKLLGCPDPPDKPRMTSAQKRIKQAVKVWFAKAVGKFERSVKQLKRKVMG